MPRFRLTPDTHFLLEVLTDKQYYANGKPRTTERHLYETIKQGLFHPDLYPTVISSSPIINQLRQTQRESIDQLLRKYSTKYPRYLDYLPDNEP